MLGTCTLHVDITLFVVMSDVIIVAGFEVIGSIAHWAESHLFTVLYLSFQINLMGNKNR